MSERPFMQLYVSDFLGDTLGLSTEGIGAYMLLLMAMWNAGGSLPDDDAKLARIVRMSVKKWRSVSADLIGYFERRNGTIAHHRLTKELQKSESKSVLRASAGAEGGRAKALKDKSGGLAKATVLPQHLPDTINQNAATQQGGKFFFDRLLEAASARGPCHPNLAMGFTPIADLRRLNYTDEEILETVAAKAKPDISNWKYFVPIVIQRASERAAIPQRPAAPSEDWAGRVAAWHQDATWIHAWGPKPGERGCRAPRELLERTAA